VSYLTGEGSVTKIIEGAEYNAGISYKFDFRTQQSNGPIVSAGTHSLSYSSDGSLELEFKFQHGWAGLEGEADLGKVGKIYLNQMTDWLSNQFNVYDSFGPFSTPLIRRGDGTYESVV